jgi:hypothetical protein
MRRTIGPARLSLPPDVRRFSHGPPWFAVKINSSGRSQSAIHTENIDEAPAN